MPTNGHFSSNCCVVRLSQRPTPGGLAQVLQKWGGRRVWGTTKNQNSPPPPLVGSVLPLFFFKFGGSRKIEGLGGGDLDPPVPTLGASLLIIVHFYNQYHFSI